MSSKLPEKDARWRSCFITKKQEEIIYLFCDVTYWGDMRWGAMGSLYVAMDINLGKVLFLGTFFVN